MGWTKEIVNTQVISRKGGTVTYIVNEKTQAITSINSDYYRTKIYEENDIIYATEAPMTILEKSCLHYGSSFEGRREVAKQILNTNSKLPVAIKPFQGIFFLPTTSHRNEECVWFSYYHVENFVKSNSKLAVILNNNQVIHVNISYNQFDLQMKRTSQLIAYFYQLCITQNKMVVFI